MMNSGCCQGCFDDGCSCCNSGCGSGCGGSRKNKRSGGLLKFSGVANILTDEGPVVSYLADAGVGPGIPFVTLPPSYPVAIKRKLQNFAVNLSGAVIASGTLLVELLQNGTPLSGFSVTYSTGQSGIKTVQTSSVDAPIGSTFDVRVTATGTSGVAGYVNLSATVGIR